MSNSGGIISQMLRIRSMSVKRQRRLTLGPPSTSRFINGSIGFHPMLPDSKKAGDEYKHSSPTFCCCQCC